MNKVMADEQQQAERVNTTHHAIPVAIQPMPEFKPEAYVCASLATRWDKWLSDFEKVNCCFKNNRSKTKTGTSP